MFSFIFIKSYKDVMIRMWRRKLKRKEEDEDAGREKIWKDCVNEDTVKRKVNAEWGGSVADVTQWNIAGIRR